MADHFRLFMDFLRHEVLVVTLVDQLRRCRGFKDWTFDFAAMLIVNLHALAREHGPVTVFQVADRVGEWCQSDRIGAEIHLAITVTNREWRSLSRTYQEVVFARKKKC